MPNSRLNGLNEMRERINAISAASAAQLPANAGTTATATPFAGEAGRRRAHPSERVSVIDTENRSAGCTLTDISNVAPAAST